MIPSPRLVSIVVPFHNEVKVVNAFYQAICLVFDPLHDVHFEMVCVEDGSTDGTLSALLGIANNDDRIRIIEFSRNFGKEAALTAGIDNALGDAVIPIDADLQDPPQVISELIKKWMAGAEVVLARRSDRSVDSFSKRKSAELFYRFHNKLSSLHIPHNVGDFRLMDRVVVDAIKRLPESQRFMKGLFSWVGFKTEVVDYVRESRSAGDTKFSGWKLWNFAIEGITGFSTVPLKVWTYAGLLGALIAFIYGSFIFIRTLVEGVDLPGYASLLVAILFMGSLQLVSIGLFGRFGQSFYTIYRQLWKSSVACGGDIGSR
jgi:polyisoprenyl-phosphate glycosyltransferase